MSFGKINPCAHGSGRDPEHQENEPMSNVISLAAVRQARQAGAPKPTPSPPPVATAPPPARPAAAPKPEPPKPAAPAQLRWRQSQRGNPWTKDPGTGLHLVLYETRRGWRGRVTQGGSAWFEDMPGVCSVEEARAWAEHWLGMHCVPSAAAAD
jgi:hypothetical protein